MIILYIIIGILALIVLTALFSRKSHYVKRDIIIQTPRQKVFDYIKFIQNQETFNTNAMEDSGRKKEFKGTDGTVGYVYTWSGNKDAGKGEKEIMAIEEGKTVEMEIRFTKPMKAVARIIMETTSMSNGQTFLSWSNAGTLPVPVNLFIPNMEKHVAKDMDKSLLILKGLLEA